jgi:hypothetical protein
LEFGVNLLPGIRGETITTNYLKAVFWDYPGLCNPEAIENQRSEIRATEVRGQRTDGRKNLK